MSLFFSKTNRDNLRYPWLLHSYAIHNGSYAHGALAMRDHDELRLIAHFTDQIVEPSYVGLIERRIDLIKDAERAGLILEDANQKRQRGQRLLAAGEQEYILQFLAGRRCDDVDAALRGVLNIGQPHESLPATEELTEGDLKILVDTGKRLF